jgi:hypothetical protein
VSNTLSDYQRTQYVPNVEWEAKNELFSLLGNGVVPEARKDQWLRFIVLLITDYPECKFLFRAITNPIYGLEIRTPGSVLVRLSISAVQFGGIHAAHVRDAPFIEAMAIEECARSTGVWSE